MPQLNRIISIADILSGKETAFRMCFFLRQKETFEPESAVCRRAFRADGERRKKFPNQPCSIKKPGLRLPAYEEEQHVRRSRENGLLGRTCNKCLRCAGWNRFILKGRGGKK